MNIPPASRELGRLPGRCIFSRGSVGQESGQKSVDGKEQTLLAVSDGGGGIESGIGLRAPTNGLNPDRDVHEILRSSARYEDLVLYF